VVTDNYYIFNNPALKIDVVPYLLGVKVRYVLTAQHEMKTLSMFIPLWIFGSLTRERSLIRHHTIALLLFCLLSSTALDVM
jgi:hypothetical protein